MNHDISWQTIENELHTLERAENGYSQAHRGTVTMPDGHRVFAKIGIDENTKQWAQKEIAVYEFLATHDYAHIPQLLAHNDERTAFALEVLDPNMGWNWENEWTHERLQVTLDAMDQLAMIEPSETEMEIFAGKGISESSNGWQPLAESDEKQAVLQAKLEKAGHAEFMKQFDIAAMTEKSLTFVFRKDGLVHYDVRADNCAWNPRTQTLKLIDWNWTQIGDRRIDLNVMLVHVHRAGFDIVSRYLQRLDADTLQWLAGFWLNAAASPMWQGGEKFAHLRDFQLEAGVAALKLRQVVLDH